MVVPLYADYVVARGVDFGMRLIHFDPVSVIFYLCYLERHL